MAQPIFYKKVDESYPIGLIYSAPDLASGETISSAVVTVDPTGLSLDGAPVSSGAKVSQSISGGILGKRYTLKFKVTTSVGYEYVDTILVEIVEDDAK